jgi:arylsulfatase A-like enzyme
MRPVAALAALLCVSIILMEVAVGYTSKRAPDAEPVRVANPRRPVKLAVLVVFDQLRGDYLERWRPLFGSGGFARLQTEGAWFTHCNYPYATTSTGPGHASILSGTCPDRHGIINNTWAENGSPIYCAGSPRYQLVPPAPPTPETKVTTPGKARPKEAGTPERMLAEGVADVLRARHPKSRIFGLSLKDRSAILPVGKHPDGAYWFDGRFVTSTYYGEEVHPWVKEFNESKRADRWFGQDWTRLRPDIAYERWSGPDVALGEGSGTSVAAKDDPARGWSQGIAFPHPNTGGRGKPGKEYYNALANSPSGNELLLELTKKCIDAERLGTRSEPDLLVVSFSSNDLIGHTWGPDSQEVMDTTLRSDVVLAELLSFLDARVGQGGYILALTADHGVCPLVESPLSRQIHARRTDTRTLQRAVDEHLTVLYGGSAGESPVPEKANEKVGEKKSDRKQAWVEAFGEAPAITFPWLYLNPRLAAAAGRTREEAAGAAAAYLRSRPEVARVFTRADMAGPVPAGDAIAHRVARSYHPERSGDLYVLLRPYDLPSEGGLSPSGTTHGTPYNYDTHVPLLVYGPGVPGGASREPTTPQAIAAIFSRWLELRLPDKAEYPLPAALDVR